MMSYTLIISLSLSTGFQKASETTQAIFTHRGSTISLLKSMNTGSKTGFPEATFTSLEATEDTSVIALL